MLNCGPCLMDRHISIQVDPEGRCPDCGSITTRLVPGSDDLPDMVGLRELGLDQMAILYERLSERHVSMSEMYDLRVVFGRLAAAVKMRHWHTVDKVCSVLEIYLKAKADLDELRVDDSDGE